MASTAYNELKRKLLAGEIDFDADDVRVRLVMTNTTCGSENDAIVNLADFTTIDPHDGANYVDKALASKTVTKVDAGDLAYFDAADITWTSLGAGTRNVAGMLVYLYVDGTNANDIALFYLEKTGVPNGNDFQAIFGSQGLLRMVAS